MITGIKAVNRVELPIFQMILFTGESQFWDPHCQATSVALISQEPARIRVGCPSDYFDILFPASPCGA